MPNIENVIKALECCQFERQCDVCPYNTHGADDCDDWLVFDAKRLLKQYQSKDVMAPPDAVPVRHEKWVVINAFRDNVYDIAGHRTWSIVCQCSGCGFVYHFIESHMRYVFCPNCGAKMDKGDD